MLTVPLTKAVSARPPKPFACETQSAKRDSKQGAEIMKKLVACLLCAHLLASCGTAQGVMNGVGEVLDGMGRDARSIGGMFN